VIVGVNKFTVKEPPFDKLFTVDDSIRKVQIEKLNAVKAKRNQPDVDAALSALETSAREGTNLMPGILTAVEVYTSLGEISDTLRKVYGEYTGM
jgi:methylmalonyl-CoA mutase N-terminal domain/subunit